jgi:hypothetical protein
VAAGSCHCTPIGEVTDTGNLRAFHDGELQGEIRAEHLTEEAPRYTVEPDAAPRPRPRPMPASRRPPREQALLELLASPNIRSRSWIYERYDQLVGSRTVRRPGLGAAVLRLRPSLRGLALSLDGPGPGRRARSPYRRRARRPRGRRATSPAPAESRSASPTASTSATRRRARSRGSSPRRSRGWRWRPRPAASRSSPGTSRSTTRPTAARSRRHPWSAASGSSPTCAPFQGRWREGRCDRPRRRAGALVRRLGVPGALGARWVAALRNVDIAAEVTLIEFLWRAAPLFSLAHDASAGGIAVALAQAGALERHRRGSRARRRRTRLVRRGRRAGSRRLRLRRAPETRGRRAHSHRRGRRRQAARSEADRSRAGLRVVCGVLGISAPDRDVARLAHFGLHALQHRGQESAGSPSRTAAT